MDKSEENFFEELTGVKTKADNDYEVELVKAETTVQNHHKSEIKSSDKSEPKMIEQSELEEKWNNGEPEGKLMVDVYETEENIVIESAIAGAVPENIDISATSDSVSIRGIRTREKTDSNENYIYQECYWGKFARSIILPQEVDPENASVTFKNGVLTIKLPKINRKKSKKLRVRVD